MQCWECGITIQSHPFNKIGFRDTCDRCSAALHCCRNCVYYQPGLSNDCKVPNTEFVADRTKGNFCEEFKVLGKAPEKRIDPNDVAKRLFKDKQ